MPKFNAPIDLNKSELRNAVVQNLASAPASPLAGQIYYSTASNALFFYNGTTFTQLASGSTPQATASAVGTVQLAGDLGGTGTTATAPVITNLAITTAKIAANAVTIGKLDTTSVTLDVIGAPAADVNLNSHKITSLATPTSNTDAATKAYVDTTAQGLSPKPSARVETTGGETYTIASGTVTQITGTTVNGVSPAVNDRILIMHAPAASGAGGGAGTAATNQPGNGLYIVTGNTTNLSVSRDTTMSGTNAPAGAYVFVETDSAGYVVSTPSTNAAFTYGTGTIQWTQFSGAGEITAGTGLTKTGNTLSLSKPVPAVYTTTITGTGAATSFTVTPSQTPTLTGAWQVTTISQSTGAIEYCDVSINQATNVITITFTTAPANGTVYSVIVVG